MYVCTYTYVYLYYNKCVPHNNERKIFLLVLGSEPEFLQPIMNQTVAIGRDAMFTCVVSNLKGYRVSKNTVIFPKICTHLLVRVELLSFLLAFLIPLWIFNSHVLRRLSFLAFSIQLSKFTSIHRFLIKNSCPESPQNSFSQSLKILIEMSQVHFHWIRMCDILFQIEMRSIHLVKSKHIISDSHLSTSTYLRWFPFFFNLAELILSNWNI